MTNALCILMGTTTVGFLSVVRDHSLNLCLFPVDLNESNGFPKDQYFRLKNYRENFIKSLKEIHK